MPQITQSSQWQSASELIFLATIDGVPAITGLCVDVSSGVMIGPIFLNEGGAVAEWVRA